MPPSKTLRRVADDDPRVEDYEFTGDGEDAPHWLHLVYPLTLDGGSAVNGKTVHECLDDLKRVKRDQKSSTSMPKLPQ